jgi:hypothetical protein
MPTEVVFAIELLALASGIGILRLGDTAVYAKRLVRAAGFFISIAAAATLISTAFFEIKFACGDFYESPFSE